MGAFADLLRKRMENPGITGQGLGKEPDLSYLRRGADSLPSRQLGGQVPMHNLIMSPGRQGSTWWENQAYEMEKLAEQLRTPVQGPRKSLHEGGSGMAHPGMLNPYPQQGPPTPQYTITGDVNDPNIPSPGLGTGTPNIQTYEDYSFGYPGTASANPDVHPNGFGDPLLILLQTLLNRRFPNGD